MLSGNVFVPTISVLTAGIGSIIYGVWTLRSTMATKQDISESKTDIKELRGEMKTDIKELKFEIEKNKKELKEDMKTQIDRVVAAVNVIFAGGNKK